MPPTFSNSVTLFVTFTTICWFKARESWRTLKKPSVMASVNYQIDRVLDFYVCWGTSLNCGWGYSLRRGSSLFKMQKEHLYGSVSAFWVWMSHDQSASHSSHASPPLPCPPCHYGLCLSGAVILNKTFLLHIALVSVSHLAQLWEGKQNSTRTEKSQHEIEAVTTTSMLKRIHPSCKLMLRS